MYDEAANEEESEVDEDDEDEDEGDEGLGTEIQDLQSLVNDIQNAEKRYSLKDAWSSPTDSREPFSAILVTSEKRTLQLYVDAIHLILSKGKGESDTKETKASSTAPTGESKDGSNLCKRMQWN